MLYAVSAACATVYRLVRAGLISFSTQSRYILTMPTTSLSIHTHRCTQPSVPASRAERARDRREKSHVHATHDSRSCVSFMVHACGDVAVGPRAATNTLTAAAAPSRWRLLNLRPCRLHYYTYTHKFVVIHWCTRGSCGGCRSHKNCER